MITEKYRPKDFNEILGNEENIEYLEKVIKQKDHSHSFLFYGEYGCGKTTLANILSSKFKCEENILINGSNTRGIDTVREVIESCKYKTLLGENKCFIVDECHKMTNEAQNALLDILEKPPEYVYFMLCTTNPEKLLKTIKSRCIQIEVETISIKELLLYLYDISIKENKEVSKKVCRKIAQSNQGHVRDSLKMLEKIMEIEDEEKQLKIAESKFIEEEEILNLCRALAKQDNWKEARDILKKLNEDPEKIRLSILGYMSSVLLNTDSKAIMERSALVIESLSDPLYNAGKAGLILGCFQSFL